MAVNRYYSSTAVDTTLAVGISASATTMVVASVTGFPTSYPYTLAIDYDTSLEELVNVVGASGTTLTVGTTVGVADITGRGVDQGVGYRVAHAAGAVVKHIISGRDVREPQEHIAASTNVHGIADTSALVTATSTTVMTNKSLTSPSLTGTVDVTAGTLALGTTGSITANSVTIDATELGYVNGVTSNIQTQLGTLTSDKAPIASPTFTGTVTIPTGASITSPTISGGTITSPTVTNGSIGGANVSFSGGGTLNLGVGTTTALTADATYIKSSEVAALSGVTSGIQGQFTSLTSTVNGKLTIPTAWTAYTPVFGGTGTPAAGTGNATGAWQQVGKTVNFRVNFTFGTGSNMSTGLTITLPSTPGNPIANHVGQCVSVNGGSRYGGEVLISTGGTCTPLVAPLVTVSGSTGTPGANRNITTAVPFTWATGDQLIISGTYEVA